MSLNLLWSFDSNEAEFLNIWAPKPFSDLTLIQTKTSKYRNVSCQTTNICKPWLIVFLDVWQWCLLAVLSGFRGWVGPSGAAKPVNRGHCLTIESRKLLWMLSCIWAWLLTRADNQIYSPESVGVHNAPHCRRPPLCLSPASRPPLLPCSKANYTPQKHKSPWFKKSLFFQGFNLVRP